MARENNRLGPDTPRWLRDLHRDNPWPELPPDDVEPFYLALDAGGRHLVTDIIQERKISLMVEVGCFLCGSTRQWLESRPEITVIGVDPWEDNWGNYILKKTAEGKKSMRMLDDPAATARTVVEYGNYRIALNNVRPWRDRFVPIRQRSPQALHYLRRRGIRPQLIYIDAYKEEEDLRVAYELFPEAVLCGDDWDWRDEHGELVMQKTVQAFASEQGFGVESEGATWVLTGTGKPWSRVTSPTSAPKSAAAAPPRRRLARTMLDRFAGALDRADLADVELLVLGCDAATVDTLIAQDLPIGRYVGVSHDAELVERLTEEVEDPRFEFHHIDIRTAVADPALIADGLPIGDQTFDLVFAVSLFDHLDPAGYRALLGALERHARPSTRLAYTVLLDERTPGGRGAIDAYVDALGEQAASTTDRFQDYLPEEPLRMALYERAYARELLETSGWVLVRSEDPAPPFQHLFTARLDSRSG